MNMEVEDSVKNDYPYAETDVWPSGFSTSENIDRHFWEQSQQNKKFQLLQTNTPVLYPEILVEIFSYLNIKDLCSVVQVCKSWREAAYTKCLWQNIRVYLDLTERDSVALASLVQRGIEKLHIRSTEKRLPELELVLPNLKSLHLSESYDDCRSFWEYSDYTPQLDLLNLSSCRLLTDKCVGQLAVHCKNLYKLELNNCNNITDYSLMLIAWGLKNLKVLSFRSCNTITNLGIKHIVGHSSSSSSDGNRLLERLVLVSCKNISDAGLKYLSDGFMEHLKGIKIADCTRITDVGVKHLSKISTLRELRVQDCPKVTGKCTSYFNQYDSKWDVLQILFPGRRTVRAMDRFVIESKSINFCSGLNLVSKKY